MLKTTYERFPPKLLTYRSYEHSWNDSLKNKFESEAYAIQSGDIRSLKTAIRKSLNAVAPFKKRIVREKKNAQYRKNTKLQIFSTNILLISQRH